MTTGQPQRPAPGTGGGAWQTRCLSFAFALLLGCAPGVGVYEAQDPNRPGLPPLSRAPGCDEAAYRGATLASVRTQFARDVYPLLTQGGCAGCHGPGSDRPFRVGLTADETFTHNLEARTFERVGPSSLLNRLTVADPAVRMPKGGSAWSAGDLAHVQQLVCALEAVQHQTCLAAAEPGPNPVRRLTAAEYNASVRDLLGNPQLPTVELLVESRGESFDNDVAAQTIDNSNVEKYLSAAEQVAAAANLQVLSPCVLASASPPRTCVEGFSRAFGERAWRRPLSSEEVALFAGFWDAERAKHGAPTALRMVIQAFLLSPHFLYRVELGEPGAPGQTVRLTGYELAARLSYFLRGTTPDDALLAAARDGALRSADQVLAQAERLLDSGDVAARQSAHRFFAQWSHLDELAEVVNTTTGFDALREDFQKETDLFWRDLFWNGGTWGTLLDADYTFVNAPLAAHYGLANGPANASTWARTPLAGAARRGLLTQASWLAVHAHPDQTDPIRRGKFVRQQLLCQKLSLPQGLEVSPPLVNTTTTTRERFEAHRIPECASCHALLDPIGYTFEHYDNLGRWRDADNGFPVDDSGALVFTSGEDGAIEGGAPELTARLTTSSAVEQCVGRQMFRFAFGRTDSRADGCSLAQALGRLKGAGGSLRQLMLSMTQTDAFLYIRKPKGAAP